MTLSKAEAWLQANREATLEDYRGQLDALKVVCEPVAIRYQDSLMRRQMTHAIVSTIANYRSTVENSEDRYAEIPAAIKSKILNACSELEQWLSEMKAAQEHLPD